MLLWVDPDKRSRHKAFRPSAGAEADDSRHRPWFLGGQLLASAPGAPDSANLAQSSLLTMRFRRAGVGGECPQRAVLTWRWWWSAFATLRLDAFLALLLRDSLRLLLACPAVAHPKVRHAEVGHVSGS